MLLRHGSYRHRLGSVSLSISRKTLFTDAGMAWAEEQEWTIDGMLTSNQSTASAARAEIKTLTAQLEAGYSRDGQDLILYFPDGTTPSHHVLRNSACLGGTRIIQPPHYQDGKSVEGVTKRTFRIVVSGVIPKRVSELPTAIKSFEESLEFEPAGAKYGHLETKVGRAVKQQLRRHQVYRAVQRGSAVGLYSRPLPPNAIFPAALVHQQPLIRRASPKAAFNTNSMDFVDFGIQWEYLYESAFLLNGVPNAWL